MWLSYSRTFQGLDRMLAREQISFPIIMLPRLWTIFVLILIGCAKIFSAYDFLIDFSLWNQEI